MGECYLCGRELQEEYQVMLYDPYLEFKICCSMECANQLKNNNSDHLYDRYRTVDGQCIQRIK